MSPAYRRLADYFVERPYELAFLSAADLGRSLRLSAATVVRFAESLGLRGYSDLRAILRAGLRHEFSTVVRLERTSRASGGESLLRRSLGADIANLERTGELVADPAFQRAVDILSKARVVHFVGLRSTLGLAHVFSFYLDMIGRPTRVIVPGVGDLVEQLLGVRPEDAGVAISFRRYTRQTVEVFREVERAGASTVAITDSELSPLAEFADVCLCVGVRFPSFFESFVGALGLINGLLTGIALARPRETREALRRREAAWAQANTYLDGAFPGGFRTRVEAFEAIRS
ncbi:MAG: MurR/RpiR family transcriptional regulator [Candidatus Rokubacteria bacterium]|nr:MurR/RpiR family transcriptional regulator [Candidatus Rokubacteria bacterium]